MMEILVKWLMILAAVGVFGGVGLLRHETVKPRREFVVVRGHLPARSKRDESQPVVVIVA